MSKKNNRRNSPKTPQKGSVKPKSRVIRVLSAVLLFACSHRTALSILNLVVVVNLLLTLVRILDRNGVLEFLFPRGLADGIGGVLHGAVSGGILLLAYGESKLNKFGSRTKSGIVRLFGHVGLTVILVVVSIPMQMESNRVSGFCFTVPGKPADISKKEIKVILAQFEQMSGNPLEPNREWARVLEEARKDIGDKLNITIQVLPNMVKNEKEAILYSDCLNGSMVIWGTAAANELVAKFQATSRWCKICSPKDLDYANSPSSEQAKLMSPGEEPRFALYYLVGLIYSNDAKFEDAIASYTKALEWGKYRSSEEIAAILTERGLQHYYNGSFDLAIGDYRTSLVKDPNNATTYNNLGLVYQDKGQFETAIAYYKTAIEKETKFALVYSNLGTVYFAQGQFETAIAYYKTAIEKDPDLWRAYYNLGTLYSKRGESDLAIANLRIVTEKQPNFVSAHYNLGNAYLNRGEYDLAIASYTRAIELDPNFAPAYYNRGNALAPFGKKVNWRVMDQAIADYTKAIEKNPNFALAYYNRAVLREALGENELALSDLNQYLKLTGDTKPEAMRFLADLKRKVGK